MMRGMTLAPPDHEAIAADALAAMDDARQIAPFSARYPGLTLDDAYRISARLCALRTARGERVIGRKIGFTNRTIWAEYAVYVPMWGFVFDTTVRDLSPPRQAVQHPFTLAPFAEPRIEPEIVFRLAAAPSPDMDEAALFGCIDWVAQGFEIVQSVFRAGSSRPQTPSLRSICGAMAPWSIAAMPPMCSTARCLRCAISSACSRAIRSIRRSQPATSSPPAP
jgi:2-keto-4-pentenoate hydratase